MKVVTVNCDIQIYCALWSKWTSSHKLLQRYILEYGKLSNRPWEGSERNSTKIDNNNKGCKSTTSHSFISKEKHSLPIFSTANYSSVKIDSDESCLSKHRVEYLLIRCQAVAPRGFRTDLKHTSRPGNYEFFSRVDKARGHGLSPVISSPPLASLTSAIWISIRE